MGELFVFGGGTFAFALGEMYVVVVVVVVLVLVVVVVVVVVERSQFGRLKISISSDDRGISENKKRSSSSTYDRRARGIVVGQ